MVARYAGAGLGLLAFALSALAGLYAGNSVTSTLSRCILALFVFFLIGTVLGMAAEAVVLEYVRKEKERINERPQDAPAAMEGGRVKGSGASVEANESV